MGSSTLGKLISLLREDLNREHKGIGGLYFITTMVVCAFILFATVRISWDSQAIAMADNLAYITAINIAVNGYIDNVYIPGGRYEGALGFTNHPYNPLADFNSMMRDAGIISGSDGSKEYWASWNGKNAIVQYGEFKTSLGSTIKPHQQESIIEDN